MEAHGSSNGAITYTSSYPLTSSGSTYTLSGLDGTITVTEEVKCKFAGHSVDPPLAEYVDGLVAGSCVHCGDRITMPAPVGGTTFLRVKALAEIALRDDFDRTTALEEFAALVVKVNDDTFALQEARKLLDLVAKLLGQ